VTVRGRCALTRPLGSEPGDLSCSRGEIRYASRYPVEIVDRIDAGASFVACLVHGLLADDPDLAIRPAAYAAAIGLATPGDIDYFAPEDLAAITAGIAGALLR
jgi:sugar/nucleoside kinase (ribokinase family)